jgi:hypothetical protein
VEHVKAERNVLAEVHNPYIVKLYYSFQVKRQAALCSLQLCNCLQAQKGLWQHKCPGQVRLAQLISTQLKAPQTNSAQKASEDLKRLTSNRSL